MRKTHFVSITIGILVLFLMTACSEDSKNTNTATQPEASSTEVAVNTGGQDDSILDQPVNFSTPEEVEKTLKNIREQAGDGAYNNLNGAMQYMLAYDLGVGHNKAKLHKKLDGKTPREILSSIKR